MGELNYHVVEEIRGGNIFKITSHTQKDALKKAELLKNPLKNPTKQIRALGELKAKPRYLEIPDKELLTYLAKLKKRKK